MESEISKENKSLNLKKKPAVKTTSKPLKKIPSLKFVQNIVTPQKSDTISQDNLTSSIHSDRVSSSIISDNTVLTNELVVMSRELTKLKSEIRLSNESLKKSEKERYDVKKSLEGKDTALEKLRKDKEELWAIVNTDKYKNIRTSEIERERLEK